MAYISVFYEINMTEKIFQKKKKKKKALLKGGAEKAVKVFGEKIQPAGWRFFQQNPEGLTFTADGGWRRKSPIFAAFF